VYNLPKNIKQELIEVYLEYETRESVEAKIVKDADTLELAFQSLEYLQI
jgi:5'-deoxynucleotidase YfbR-like HD superfamily hydrolase